MSHSDVQSSALRLPEGWSQSERVEDVVDADGLKLHRVGLCARSSSDQALGSAADCDAPPTARGTFEVLERIVVLEAARGSQTSFPVRNVAGELQGSIAQGRAFPSSTQPERWIFARSNGVALHHGWARACASAEQELVERDRVLRAWLGETTPLAIDFDRDATPLVKTRSYDWSACAFPPRPDTSFGHGIDVVGVFGFPRGEEAPIVFGYGARTRRSESLAAAVREALQLLAFLWGEPVTRSLPDSLPTPMTHLETFQYPGRRAVLRRWLENGHAEHRGRDIVPQAGGAVRFIDLTPAWLSTTPYRVAKAVCDDALPLTFGASPFFEDLPAELRLHPIP